jgi:hypothetical protein
MENAMVVSAGKDWPEIFNLPMPIFFAIFKPIMERIISELLISGLYNIRWSQ